MKKPQSPFNGVSFHKPTSKWVPSVLLNKDEEGKRKLKNIGYFEDDLQAAEARNKYIEENELKCRKSKIEGVVPTGDSKAAMNLIKNDVAEQTQDDIVTELNKVSPNPVSVFDNNKALYQLQEPSINNNQS